MESEEIYKLWYNHIYYSKQPDPRLKRHPFHALAPENLKLSIGPETSIIVRDKKTAETVLVVMRNACKHEGAVLSVDATVVDATKQKKSIRVSEPINLLYLVAN